MIVMVALVLTVLTFIFIIYPLFKQRSRSVDSASADDDQLRALYSKRDTTYSMLKELEFDHLSGILSEGDYRDLEIRYKRKAVSLLRNIGDLERGAKVEEEIEKCVLELRRDKGLFCHQCGTGYQEDDSFCSGCGTNLSRGERID